MLANYEPTPSTLGERGVRRASPSMLGVNLFAEQNTLVALMNNFAGDLSIPVDKRDENNVAYEGIRHICSVGLVTRTVILGTCLLFAPEAEGSGTLIFMNAPPDNDKM
uniref:Uncharacterized protein n=1 Tax=Romanomermis culicivorax TaxID=13658 RepID=A0A915HFX9_ROMCU